EEDDSVDDEDDSLSEQQCDVAEEMTTADDNDSTKLESSRKRKYDGNQSISWKEVGSLRWRIRK
ncbi:hypothetical protein LINPERHAP1_LOCUS25065, partial [Linum perenne]